MVGDFDRAFDPEGLDVDTAAVEGIQAKPEQSLAAGGAGVGDRSIEAVFTHEIVHRAGLIRAEDGNHMEEPAKRIGVEVAAHNGAGDGVSPGGVDHRAELFQSVLGVEPGVEVKVVESQGMAAHVRGGGQGDAAAGVDVQVELPQGQHADVGERIAAEDGQAVRPALLGAASRSVGVVHSQRLGQLAGTAGALRGVTFDFLQEKNVGAAQHRVPAKAFD